MQAPDASQTTTDTGRASASFNPGSRQAHRRPPPWNRLAYIARLLPATLHRLAAGLEVEPGVRILDYGCADVPYRDFFPPGAEYLAADLPGNPDSNVEIQPDGTLPMANESVDAIVSTQVLEHVADPSLYLAECSRVLRPGGRMLLSTHGIMVYHPDPVDLWRWTGEGLRRQVENAGFEVLRFEGLMGLGGVGIQLVQDSFYYRLPRPLRPVVALCAQALIALVDRFESREAKSSNALVFALIAGKG